MYILESKASYYQVATTVIGGKLLIIDDRQIVEHPEIPELLGLECTVLRLGAGDYCFLDFAKEPVGIEQSEIGNFVQKLRSGELESQMRGCQELYSSVILLIQGVYDRYDELLALYKGGNKGYFRSYIYPHTTYQLAKATEIRLSGMGIEVISSPNFGCSMDIIRLIYNQRTKPPEAHTLFKKIRKVEIPVKLSANPNVSRLLGLVPRMPEKVAITLIYKYDSSIWRILQASDKELMEIKGMGKNLVDRLRDNIGQP